ncbi:MAG: SDR family oxidoreductase [Deltaproteobacteria bacterium]|nr:SDR family oxidoreductase [Deltaproteobacteria bacterium]
MRMFKDKTAIVTGAASGIGKALSEELAKRDAIVILTDVNAELLEKTTASIRADGYNAEPVVIDVIIDVTKFADLKKLVDDTITKYRRLDYLFNNAGIAVFAEARDYTYEEEWRKVIDIDIYGPVNGAAAAFPKMVEQGFGHIVNTASLAGLIPASLLCSYSVAKHGVVGLSLTLRMEGKDLGVKVSVVCPGLIQTPIYQSRVIKLDQEQLLDKAPPGMPPEKCARIILRGVKRNKPIIVVSVFAKILWGLYRISPGMMLRLGEIFTRRFRKEYRIA